MPLIRVDIGEGRTLERKRSQPQRPTKGLNSVTGARSDRVQLIFADVAKGNWSYAGILHRDNNPWSPAPAQTIQV
ncbi:tautomerase family protein [Noviherbaspirillum aerium]|uniref:tautomerase family protein n=1 Tax=Noviherbaspirillum aerium TaxID=2588497 RepID=UPI00124DFD2D